MRAERHFQVIVIGGGHAGVEAAWAAANLIGEPGSVALVTQDPSKIGVMSCNPAIGGLAKGQIVREIDALGGLMGLATDATGIQFKVLNTSKGPAVHGPRAQCDKHAYAEQVQRMIAGRHEIVVIGGSVEKIDVRDGRVCGVVVTPSKWQMANKQIANQTEADVASGLHLPFGDLPFAISAPAAVLTTGTFMRGLMHTGESRTEGGRFGEAPAVGISGALKDLGFELGRLKTGTPPRLKRSSLDWDGLARAGGDARPKPFSDLTGVGSRVSGFGFRDSNPSPETRAPKPDLPSLSRFPILEQVDCRVTETNAAVHDCIRANLHRAPMYSGQIESAGPRYCPSIEDKVVRFAERDSHSVYLEPESLRQEGGHDEWIYCNGISTSLPADVQDVLVRSMPGCERAEILRYGYAVEYDMVRPHQLAATGMTKLVDGLFLAGQINGTSGYEEAAGQGLIAGINAARFAAGGGQEPITLGRDAAYIGVLMDDLATKTPIEPYRMFTSRAEHRLLLRADNAPDRLTPLARDLGLLRTTPLGRLRERTFAERAARMAELNRAIDTQAHNGLPLREWVRRHDFGLSDLAGALGVDPNDPTFFSVHADRAYAPFIERQQAEVRRSADLERRRIPGDFDYMAIPNIRTEARHALHRFRPATLGQAGRLEGLTPADVTLLAVLVERHNRGKRDLAPA